MLTVGGLMTACASGPVRPVPKATAKPELPKWYPEAPWTE